MAHKDLILKKLFQHNDFACQFINAFVFDCKDVVKPDQLIDGATRYSSADSTGKLKEIERDILKEYYVDGVLKGYFAIENQTTVDDNMMERLLKYDGISYEKLRKNNKKKKEIITLVLHFGTDNQWTAEIKFSDTLDHMTDNPKGKSEFNLLVVDVAFIEDEKVLNFLTGDAKVAVYFFKSLRQGYDFLEILDTTEIKYPEEMMKLFHIFTGDKLYLEILTDEEKEKKEPIKMIELAQRMRDKYGAEARAEGRAEERKEIARSLYEDSMPIPQIAKIVKETEETVHNWLDNAAV